MIDKFSDKYDFLSNFYPCLIKYEGITYPSVEHYFQAMKTIDANKRIEISKCLTPGDAKRLGRKVNLRADWEYIKPQVMKKALRIKFSDPYLAQKLIDTGDNELIEGNWWGDTYWGVCNGVGQNHLGKLLMQIRNEINSDTEVKNC